MSLGYEDDLPLTAAARERLAKRFGCDPEDVEERCRRIDDAAWVGQLDSAISSATSAESEVMSREIADGAMLSPETIRRRLLGAFCLGMIKARFEDAGFDLFSDGTPEIDATGPPPIPGSIRLPTPSDAVAGTIDLAPTARALEAATVGEMEQIEREIERGADISQKEIRARLDLALRGVKLFSFLVVALLAGYSSFAADEASLFQKKERLLLGAEPKPPALVELPNRNGPAAGEELEARP
ncbi:MAG TPA: hypothetical protein VFC25_06245 [Verrucomicrobiae bacterium]|nr:hypothetical protein [Verrucomicrobiae bacterium]